MTSFTTTSVKHLLNRALFGLSQNDLSMALSLGSLESIVKLLLESKTAPKAPGDWVNVNPIQAQQDNGSASTWYKELTVWWNNLMFNEGLCVQEKMVLFLHNHFSNERDKVNYPQYMYKQNQLFRKYALGNFKQLVKDISIDPSMLIYLDGNNSRGTGPNENYARELLELFTLGIGNYTENDIKQIAKVVSGWQVKNLDAVFDSTRYYKETSLTVFNKTASFNINSLIDLIFEQSACAEFICRKLYQEFIYYKANEVFVKKMAEVFRKANFELKPLLEFMFLSEEFYKSEYIGSKIKNPQELMIGACKLFKMAAPDFNNIYEMGKILQMQLFQPPNVAGWPGQRDWISSTTYSYRAGFTDSLITGKSYNGVTVTGKLDTLNFIRTFINAEKADLLVEDLAELSFQYPLTSNRKSILLENLLSGTILKNWSTFASQADTRINAYLKSMMRLPEFQLI